MIEQTRNADKRIVSWLEKHGSDADTAVEFGSGIGNYIPHILAGVVYAVDSEERQLALMPAEGPATPIVGDMLEWKELGLGDFDCAVFIDSLEHVDKDEGINLIGELQNSGHVKLILAFVPMGLHPQPDHKATWEPDELEALGFDVERDDCFHNTRGKSRGAMYGVWRL